MTGDDIIEQPIATTVVYRIDVNGKNESHLDIPIETHIQQFPLAEAGRALNLLQNDAVRGAAVLMLND